MQETSTTANPQEAFSEDVSRDKNVRLEKLKGGITICTLVCTPTPSTGVDTASQPPRTIHTTIS